MILELKTHGRNIPCFGASCIARDIPCYDSRDIVEAAMPSVDRDESRESRDRELVLKHQPSISDSGRASVPM